MLFSVITPNYNGGRYLEQALRSVMLQGREEGIEVEHIVVDGISTDASAEIIQKYSPRLARVIIEKDSGPANAINKGLRIANGEVISWLNADDRYLPGAFRRVKMAMEKNPHVALCFGKCPIVDADGAEIRSFITRFKERFFRLSSLFTIQCINYVSQPAMFFRRRCLKQTGFLREDLLAAWDYDFLLRLWHCGGAAVVEGGPLAQFRWHSDSISGRAFAQQFREEFAIAAADAGTASPQAMIHWFVRWGIIGIYTLMKHRRKQHNG